MTDANKGIVYDAAATGRILGLPTGWDRQTLPSAEDREIVVYYGGWDLRTLKNSVAGEKYMLREQDWYDAMEWKAEPGYYRLLLPVPESNRKTWEEQCAHLRTIDEAWRPAPVTVAATALLLHLAQTRNDMLKGDWCRCADLLIDAETTRAGLKLRTGRVSVSVYWDDDPPSKLWLAAARKC